MRRISTFLRSLTPMGGLLAAVSVGLVGASLFVQHVLLIEPCPLCLIQRYAYALLAMAFLGVALQGRRPRVQRTLLGVALVLALIGGGVAAYQSQLQLFPRTDVVTCTAGLFYMLETLSVGDVIGRLFSARGDCSDTSFRILGLTLAQISLVIFAALVVWLIPAIWRRPLKG